MRPWDYRYKYTCGLQGKADLHILEFLGAILVMSQEYVLNEVNIVYHSRCAQVMITKV